MAKAKQQPAKKRGSGTPNTYDIRRGRVAYPITPEWQGDVKTRLTKIGMTVKDLAAKIGAAQSTVQELLNSKAARYSSLVPDIHKAIGWDPPSLPGEGPTLPSPDALELGHMFDRLPEKMRKALRDQALASLEMLDQNDPKKPPPNGGNGN